MTGRTRWATLHRLLSRLVGRDVRRAPAPATPARRVVLPDHHGPVHPLYAPSLDGDADPGEIVWGWVPYEEDVSQGKDRPVLVVARNGASVIGLMLTSKDHSRNAANEARHGRVWLDIGSGPWDARRRPSEVRLDRVVQLHPTAFRREGAVMDRALFDRVTAALRECNGW
ncbi:type II toxin-antitoxin system PemK/MazF family toxin [Cellulomonas sp. URHD0024]|uniref:type II toxin-antitoxin system PemK/MazF family toxin n=1 Tax=Cellulomonas sp. URHD0024 TaxID=1302620 RepID=UPI00042A622B|nr:type II toxin-antitoxin system PemK/MazF family toxin [Cellulomonas sp. URHD0024]